ncbi:MAG: Ldh family oxidoreductase, partial [Burkholderiaceae bacterium]
MRLAPSRLQDWAQQLYVAAGLQRDIAASVARLQVLTDAMGRRTHGLAMLPLYLDELARGRMAAAGQPQVVVDQGPVQV